jgi:hypothetical protein
MSSSSHHRQQRHHVKKSHDNTHEDMAHHHEKEHAKAKASGDHLLATYHTHKAQHHWAEHHAEKNGGHTEYTHKQSEGHRHLAHEADHAIHKQEVVKAAAKHAHHKTEHESLLKKAKDAHADGHGEMKVHELKHEAEKHRLHAEKAEHDMHHLSTRWDAHHEKDAIDSQFKHQQADHHEQKALEAQHRRKALEDHENRHVHEANADAAMHKAAVSAHIAHRMKDSTTEHDKVKSLESAEGHHALAEAAEHKAKFHETGDEAERLRAQMKENRGNAKLTDSPEHRAAHEEAEAASRDALKAINDGHPVPEHFAKEADAAHEKAPKPNWKKKLAWKATKTIGKGLFQVGTSGLGTLSGTATKGTAMVVHGSQLSSVKAGLGAAASAAGDAIGSFRQPDMQWGSSGDGGGGMSPMTTWGDGDVSSPSSSSGGKSVRWANNDASGSSDFDDEDYEERRRYDTDDDERRRYDEYEDDYRPPRRGYASDGRQDSDDVLEDVLSRAQRQR